MGATLNTQRAPRTARNFTQTPRGHEYDTLHQSALASLNSELAKRHHTRVTAQFSIEHDPKRGERAVRVTTGAPVKLTFARRMRIVDGDDGRTYIARDHGHGMVSIFRGDMKYEHETAHEPSPRYTELMQLFQNAAL
jgi:hypothetical protein